MNAQGLLESTEPNATDSSLSVPATMPTLTSIVPEFSAIGGRLSLVEAEQLFQLAASVREGVIVEIGSSWSRSMMALCAGSSAGDRVPVYAVDSQEQATGINGSQFGAADRAAFFQTLANSNLFEYIRLLNIESAVIAKGWRQPIGMLFFDCNNHCDAVKADFEAWLPHLRKEAFIVFYDSENSGLRPLLEELVIAGTIWPSSCINKLEIFYFRNHTHIAYKPTGKALSQGFISSSPGTEYIIPFREMGWHLYYGGGGKYLYQPITKCACSTIKLILLDFEGLNAASEKWHYHNKSLNGFPGTADLKREEAEAVYNGITPTFKFTFVRNPYHRLASVYTDKILMEPNPYWRGKVIRAAAGQGKILYGEISFEEFLKVVCCQTIYEMDEHWRPQYYEGHFTAISFDFIGRVERMPKDLIYVLERIGSPPHIVARATERFNEKGSDLGLWNSVSDKVRNQFHASYRLDFEEFNYSMDLPQPTIPAKSLPSRAA